MRRAFTAAKKRTLPGTHFTCPRWEEERRKLTRSQGTKITPGSTVGAMLESPAKWELVKSYVTSVMKTKEAGENKAAAALIPGNTRR